MENAEFQELVLRQFANINRTLLQHERFQNTMLEQVAFITQELTAIKQDISELRSDVNELRRDVNELRQCYGELRRDVAELRRDVNALRSDVDELRRDVNDLRQSQALMEIRLSDKIDALFEAREVQNDINIRILKRLDDMEGKRSSYMVREDTEISE